MAQYKQLFAHIFDTLLVQCNII